MHPAQYGGVPGREAQTVTLLEEIPIDYSLLTRTPYANVDNGIITCYRRILMPVGEPVVSRCAPNGEVMGMTLTSAALF